MEKNRRTRATAVAANVGANVRRIRLSAGLTLAELSSRLTEAGYPIAFHQLSKLETADRNVTVDDLTAIADALAVPPTLLLTSVPATDFPDVDWIVSRWIEAHSHSTAERAAGELARREAYASAERIEAAALDEARTACRGRSDEFVSALSTSLSSVLGTGEATDAVLRFTLAEKYVAAGLEPDGFTDDGTPVFEPRLEDAVFTADDYRE